MMQLVKMLSSSSYSKDIVALFHKQGHPLRFS